ncbi:MAG: hypothetical protein GXO74_02720 [Calditrichaeota bacterium]|nr:hypothetical protein [Calditrichota bacterium]
MREEIAFQTVENGYDWNILLNRARHVDLMQTWEYGEAIKRTVGFGPLRQLVLRNGKPLAMAQILLKEVSGIGPVARIQNGPLFFDTDEIWQPMIAVIAIRELKNYWVNRQQRHLYLSPCLFPGELPRGWHKELNLRTVSDPVWASVRLDIDRPEDEIRSQMKRHWRKALERAERENFQAKVSHSADDFQFFLFQYRLDAKNNATGWPSSDLLSAFWETSDVNSQLFLAYREEKYVAGLVTTVFADTAFALTAWDATRTTDFVGMRYLVWRAIQYHRDLRYKWFDLGGADPSRKMGASAFKRTTGGTEYSYPGNYEVFPSFLPRESQTSRKRADLHGFLPGLDWPIEVGEVTLEEGAGITSGVTRAVGNVVKKNPEWDGALNPKMPLVGSGLIDSLALVDLVQDLQEKFDVHFFPEEITSENFDSISSICRLIQEKMTVRF